MVLLSAAESSDLGLEKPEDICHEVSVGDGMVQSNGNGHHEPAALFPVPAPVDDGQEVQIAVRQFDVQ